MEENRHGKIWLARKTTHVHTAVHVDYSYTCTCTLSMYIYMELTYMHMYMYMQLRKRINFTALQGYDKEHGQSVPYHSPEVQ